MKLLKEYFFGTETRKYFQQRDDFKREFYLRETEPNRQEDRKALNRLLVATKGIPNLFLIGSAAYYLGTDNIPYTMLVIGETLRAVGHFSMKANISFLKKIDQDYLKGIAEIEEVDSANRHSSDTFDTGDDNYGLFREE